MSYPFGTKPRPVEQLDIRTDKTIKKYDSVSSAGKQFEDPYARTKITYCCQGKLKTACGFKWKYC